MTIVCTAEGCAYNRDGRCAANRIVIHAHHGDWPRCWNYIQAEEQTRKEG